MIDLSAHSLAVWVYGSPADTRSHISQALFVWVGGWVGGCRWCGVILALANLCLLYLRIEV